MKLHDPTLPYADVVSRRRKTRAAADGERFRLGAHGLDCGDGASPLDRTAVVGASAWALKPEQIETTLAHIGLVSGLLTDLGYRVCPIGAVTESASPPSFVAWVCGDETEADEYEQLEAIPAPGLSIGSCVEGLDDWRWIQPDEHPDDLDMSRAILKEIGRLLDAEGHDSPN